MAFTITLDCTRGEVTVEVIGSFDRGVGFALWQYCEPERNGYRSFVLDLSRVRVISDAARNWLTGFSIWAQEHGAELRVIHASVAIPSLSPKAP
ncbi:MAG: hypothetical protein ACREV1_15115 [Gammaproteobacteria bacterium]